LHSAEAPGTRSGVSVPLNWTSQKERNAMTVQPVHGFFARVYLRLFLLVCAYLFYSIPAGPAAEAPQIVIAVGDVHGDFDDFCLILKRAGLIGEGNHWSGGHATLIQTGDLLDRGPKEREVLDLMISLETEAVNAGGRVVALLGNHEMMNLMGDLRYVDAGNYFTFADSESDNRRQAALQKYFDWRNAHPQLLAELNQPVLPETQAEWMARPPSGFIEHRTAFSPTGIYGK